MNWEEALEIAVERRQNPRLRFLCSEEYAQHLAWRRRVIEIATGKTAPAYPPMMEQAGNVLGAAGRAMGAAVTGQQVMRSAEEQAACLAICRDCEHFVAAEERCAVCGCVMAFKVKLATEHCPLSEPKW